MTSFGDALRASLESTPDLSRRGRKILSVLNGRSSKRREAIVARWEAETRLHMDLGTGKVDWSRVGFSPALLLTLIPILLKILEVLWPLIFKGAE